LLALRIIAIVEVEIKNGRIRLVQGRLKPLVILSSLAALIFSI
jgi:hypothetical protein